MNTRTIVALGLAFAMVPLLPSGIASHSGTYAFNPLEHDDQGRSNEPDFASTGVLGTPVANRVIDLDQDGVAAADSALPPTPAGQSPVLAPGCTDDSGRQPSGLCGLFTVGAGTPNTGQVVPGGIVGVQGMGGSKAPGRFTPLKSTSLRFLDTMTHIQVNTAGSVYLEVNKKMQDSGAQSILRSADQNFGGNVIVGQTAIWPLYGKWQDKNGNGVIDHIGGTTEAPVPATNEFIWYGNCLKFGGAPNVENGTKNGYCHAETNANGGGAAEMIGYIYPGNHHAICNVGAVGPECAASPGDHPGKQAVALLALGVRAANLEDYDANLGGDTLFGTQNSVAPDQKFDDRTGDPNIGTRQWVYGLGWSTWFYDQSIAGTTIIVTAVNCQKDDSNARAYLLGTCGSLDVDEYRTWSPAAESLLLTTVKPTARSSWVTLRDRYDPANNYADSHANGATLYQAQGGPLQGDLGARTQNPGFSREPNALGDSFPGATLGNCVGEARHNGWCNSYAGYAANFLAWTDVQPGRSIYYNRPVTVTGSACTVCVAGPAQDLGFAAEPLPGTPVRGSDDHRRSLGPGGYYFVGVLGLWKDKTQVREEVILDPLTLNPVSTTYVEGPDGWVGSIVNATGTWYYRGYQKEACTTEKGSGLHTYAECHPYLDGNLVDPQQAGATSHGEWDADCQSTRLGSVVLTPDGGVWTVPVLVFRNHEQGVSQVAPNPTFGPIQDLTGTSQPIVLQMACRTSQADTSGVYLSADFVALPLGNLNLGITSSMTSTVETQAGGLSTVRDVDRYAPWGA